MSELVAAVSWDRGARPPVAAALVDGVLRGWPADAREVREVAGGIFGQGTVASDAWRRADLWPRVDEAKTLVMVSDCRLDNRTALRRRLGAPDSLTDSALIQLAFERWGTEVGQHLRGDYSVVIWDWVSRRLVAIRDPLGVKPLFYARLSGGMIIASDVEILAALARPRPVPDDRMVVEYLLWDYDSTDRTFWSTVSRLPGGHVLVATVDGETRRRYWNPSPMALGGAGAEDVYDGFRRRFFESVEHRLQSEHPIMAHLSGGVDSSSIVCVADRLYRDSTGERPGLHAVSERYPGLSCDEGPFIDAVRDVVRFPSAEWDGRVADLEDLEVPSPAGPGMRIFRTSGCAGDRELAGRIGAKVVLGGLAGDQLGAPSGLIDDLIAARRWGHLWDTIRRTDLSAAQRRNRIRLLAKTLVPRRLLMARAIRRRRRRLPDWLSSRWRELASTFGHERTAPAGLSTQVQQAHWEEITSSRLAHSIDAEQRYYSALGLEARFPFLDQGVVEYVLSFKAAHWPRPKVQLRFQREALAAILPDLIRERVDKTKFSPASFHRTRVASARLDAIFHSKDWASERWVNQAAAQRLWSRASSAQPPRVEDHRAVWRIATLEAWLRTLFGYSSPLGGSQR